MSHHTRNFVGLAAVLAVLVGLWPVVAGAGSDEVAALRKQVEQLETDLREEKNKRVEALIRVSRLSEATGFFSSRPPSKEAVSGSDPEAIGKALRDALRHLGEEVYLEDPPWELPLGPAGGIRFQGKGDKAPRMVWLAPPAIPTECTLENLVEMQSAVIDAMLSDLRVLASRARR